MVSIKLVIADSKMGKCVQKEVKDAQASVLLGKKVNDMISGDLLGFAGYEFQITGGSDYCGFPMRADVQGPVRKRILAVEGIGIKKIGRGTKQRKTVCGNTIHDKISQVNLKILKHGTEKLIEEKAEEKAAA
ncbi:30S ribosomal protein S6e [Candidatus Woesearchaeota archaeon]|nr:30S ribosomal protein S6e [Candidatus Woesearchaeota archaeon]